MCRKSRTRWSRTPTCGSSRMASRCRPTHSTPRASPRPSFVKLGLRYTTVGPATPGQPSSSGRNSAQPLPTCWPRGRRRPAALAIERRTSEQLTSTEGVSYRLERLIIGRQADGGAPATTMPALYLTPLGQAASGAQAPPPVLLVHGTGKAASFRQEGETIQPGPLLATLLGAGRPVLTCDVFLTGEYLSPLSSTGRPVLEAHFTTFNRTDAQWRVYDVVTAVAVLRQLAGAAAVDLVGADAAGLWCLLARAVAGESVRKLAVDMNGFGWDRDEDYREPALYPRTTAPWRRTHCARARGAGAAAATRDRGRGRQRVSTADTPTPPALCRTRPPGPRSPPGTTPPLRPTSVPGWQPTRRARTNGRSHQQRGVWGPPLKYPLSAPLAPARRN